MLLRCTIKKALCSLTKTAVCDIIYAVRLKKVATSAHHKKEGTIMINYKDWNMRHFGNMVILSVVLVLIIALVHTFVTPLLTTLLPTVFTTTISLTDILLFFVLVRLITK